MSRKPFLQLIAKGYAAHVPTSELVVQAGLDIPAKVMFNAYFEEKGANFRLP